MWIPQPRSGKPEGGAGKPQGREAAPGAPVRAGGKVQTRNEVAKVPTETQEKRNETPRPMLANIGAMSTFVPDFEVTSKLTGKVYRCRFSHMWNGIATRHSDTIDTQFFVEAASMVVGLAHTAFVKFRDKSKRDLTDREASFVAAEFLRERLEEEDLRPLYDVPESEVLRLIQQIGIK